MRTRSHREAFAILLAILLILPAVPLGAQESPVPEGAIGLDVVESFSGDHLSLGLGEALAAQGLNIEVEVHDAVPNGTPEAAKITRLGLAASQKAYALSQNATDPASSASPAGKKGSWWKRYWWVPVIAGVVLGAVLIADDDSDKGEEEDD